MSTFLNKLQDHIDLMRKMGCKSVDMPASYLIEVRDRIVGLETELAHFREDALGNVDTPDDTP